MKRFLVKLSTAQIAPANSRIQAGIGYVDVRHAIHNLVIASIGISGQVPTNSNNWGQSLAYLEDQGGDILLNH